MSNFKLQLCMHVVMGRRNGRNKKKRSLQNRRKTLRSLQDWNFVSEAGPGCHIARQDQCEDNAWVLEWELMDDVEDFGVDEIPDLAIDTEEHTLTLCNVDDVYKVAYITVFDCALRGRDGKVLVAGTTSDTNGQMISCTTLIVLCPPCTFCHLCYLPDTISPSSLRLESDVQEWRRHPDPSDTHKRAIGFPLQTSLQNPSFLCTQGVDGCLTHFFDGNLHAVDFRCPIGTPLTAVGKGKVVSVKVDCDRTGIAVSNLFLWNSILLELDEDSETVVDTANASEMAEITIRPGPLFVEYVHIQSAAVGVGDSVAFGQVIGTSGSVGFSPEPHLHLACYRSSDDNAPTCRVYFHTHSTDSSPSSTIPKQIFEPKAGHRYSSTGIVTLES